MRVINKKKLAIGVENYKQIIDKSYYYVDKTLLIKELLEKGSKVNLFTRPRRF
ncbi:MAG: AAA family ATPase [Lachnospiraceae bacterium]|nr:AAA family ATPase [Lachnospiraceae bacterium]